MNLQWNCINSYTYPLAPHGNPARREFFGFVDKSCYFCDMSKNKKIVQEDSVIRNFRITTQDQLYLSDYDRSLLEMKEAME